MDGEVDVTLRGFVSASEYCVEWESDGQLLRKEFEPSPNRYTIGSSWHDTFKLRPGNFLFVDWYMSDEDYRHILIQVPAEPEFERFLEAASIARQSKWRDDGWILEFGVATWDINDDEFDGWPYSLAEAIETHKHQNS